MKYIKAYNKFKEVLNIDDYKFSEYEKGILSKEEERSLDRLRTMGVIDGKKTLIINKDGTIDFDGDIYFNEMRDIIRIKLMSEMSLKFNKVSGDFDCSDCNLKNLSICPKYVGGYFACSSNNLKSLVGGPEEVGGFYNCSYNNLDSLNGLALEIGEDLFCGNNNLDSLDIVSNIEGDIWCSGNKIDPNNNEFSGYCGGKILYTSVEEIEREEE